MDSELTAEQIEHEDKVFFINTELQTLETDLVDSEYIPSQNKRFYE